MCLAIPGHIIKIKNKSVAVIDFNGIKKNVSIEMINEPKIGDYVLVHAGFAIDKIESSEAQERIAIYKELIS